uniref:Abelson helper integration site 1 n=1 Tax=Caenorhabditis tropicalis TaxID=1561998 RepID=A0A1I7UYJ3_9PELO
MDEKEKAKRLVSKSRRTKNKQESVKRSSKIKSKHRKSKHPKAESKPVIPQVTPQNPQGQDNAQMLQVMPVLPSPSSVSPHREAEVKKEDPKEQKDSVIQEKKEEKKSELLQEKKKSVRRIIEKEEKEPDSDSDNEADLEMKKSHAALPNRKGKPKKVDIKHREVDEKEMERLLKKLQENKAQPPRVPVTLDEKSKIFMDRVEKKPYPPTKYSKKNRALVEEDDPEFFKPQPLLKQKSSRTIVPIEDFYDNVPKLADVQKMPGENVYQSTLAGDVPFWALYLEPEEEDSKDVEPPISVGSEHLEAYFNRTLTLKTPKSTKVVLDEFQPSCQLTKRDEKYFHPHLIFSNTVRSLVNVQGKDAEKSSEKMVKSKTKSEDDVDMEERTQVDGDHNVTISKKQPKSYSYKRSRPILSAREEKERLQPVECPKPAPPLSPSTVDKSTNPRVEPKNIATK